MAIIKFIDHFIDKYEDMVNIAETEYYHNGHYPSWYKDMKEYQNKVEVLKEVKEVLTKALEKAKGKPKAKSDNEIKIADRPNVGKVCWSNYRVVMAVDMKSHMVKALFWTPDLKDRDGIPVQNSHHELMMCLQRACDEANDYQGSGLETRLHWCGFYTYGYGNGRQEQLTLYGESSDYGHTVNSDKVKECFLEGKPFELDQVRTFAEMVSGVPDELFEKHVGSSSDEPLPF